MSHAGQDATLPIRVFDPHRNGGRSPHSPGVSSGQAQDPGGPSRQKARSLKRGGDAGAPSVPGVRQGERSRRAVLRPVRTASALLPAGRRLCGRGPGGHRQGREGLRRQARGARGDLPGRGSEATRRQVPDTTASRTPGSLSERDCGGRLTRFRSGGRESDRGFQSLQARARRSRPG